LLVRSRVAAARQTGQFGRWERGQHDRGSLPSPQDGNDPR
jgi:hypothetical protein